MEKNVGSFNSVDVRGSMNVRLMQGTASSVNIETDDNLMPYIDIYLDGNTLVVRNKEGYNLEASKEIIVHATAPVFKDIDVSGSGDISADNIISGTQPISMHVSGSGNITLEVNATKLNTDISGSGDIALKGHVQDFTAEVSGSGKVKCFDLITDNSTLNLAGSSDAEVNVLKKLEIDVSGSGSVRYKGTASVNQKIRGSGDVRKVD
ncbi:MAG: head GIN domain-containing protein [Flavisolibacter sp.]